MYTNKVSHNGIQFIFIQIFLAKVQLIEVFSVVPLLCMCLCISILNNVNKHCRPFQFLSFCLILGIPQNIFLSRRLSYSYIYTSFSLYHNFHLLICLVVILLVHFLSQIFFLATSLTISYNILHIFEHIVMYNLYILYWVLLYSMQLGI